MANHCGFQVDPAVTHSQDDLSHLAINSDVPVAMIEFQFGNLINLLEPFEAAFEKIALLVGEGEKLKAVLEPPAMADDCPQVPSQSCSWK